MEARETPYQVQNQEEPQTRNPSIETGEQPRAVGGEELKENLVFILHLTISETPILDLRLGEGGREKRSVSIQDKAKTSNSLQKLLLLD